MITLLGLLGVAAPGRAAAADTMPVSITLDAMSPSVLRDGATLTISGAVRNTSSQAIASPQVLLWRDFSPIGDSQQLADTLASPPTLPLGARVTQVESAYTIGMATLEPNATARFTVSAPADVLGLPAAGSSYLVGVHALGVYDGRNQTVGRARTLLPYVGDGKTAPTTKADLTRAVELSSRPSLHQPDVFVDDHLAREIAAGGRLDALLSAAEDGASVLVDPGLLLELEAMTADYAVRTADGDTSPGTAQAPARAWLARYRDLDVDRYRLPYANPDLVAVSDHGDPEVTLRTATAGLDEVAGVGDLPLVVRAPGGSVGPNTLALAERLGARAALADNLGAHVGHLAGGPGAMSLVGLDADVLTGGPGPDPTATPVQVRQRLLAQTWLAGGRPTVVVADSVDEALALTTVTAPWLTSRTLAQVLAAPAGPAPVPPPGVGGNELEQSLTSAQLADAEQLADAYAAVSDLRVNSEAIDDRADVAVSQALSGWWRGHDRDSADFVNPQTDALQGELEGSRVRIANRFEVPVLMSGRDSYFPLSITNKLDVAVRVNVEFTADNPQRLRVGDIEDITIEPGQSVTVNANPHAMAAGTYQLHAQLTTANGQHVGRPARITVEANNIGKAGWVLVAGSGVVLLGGTVLRVRQVRKHGLGPAEPSPADSPTTGANQSILTHNRRDAE